MSKQPETLFKERVAKKLKAYPNVYAIKVQQVTKIGDPDFLLCANGWFVAWELKVNKNKATKLQAHKLEMIKQSGGIARVVTPENLDECLKEIECLLSYSKKLNDGGTTGHPQQ